MLAKRKLLGEYKIGRTIGEGAFSKVKLAVHRGTDKKVAIKIIKKDDEEKKRSELAKQDPQSADSVLNILSKEVKLLMRLDHPNVIKLHQVIDTPAELFIVMDYASGGELIDYIAAKGALSESEGRKFFRQLLSAMDHCHLAGVVHRDLKLENMLLSSERDLLLSDFGLGRSISGYDQYLNTFCGTPLYAAPELVSGIKYVGTTSDIWSLGIVLFVMIAGRPPFKCDSIAELYAQIKGVKYICPDTFSVELRDLLKKILVKDVTKRATMDILRQDPWVNMHQDGPPLRIQPVLSLTESLSIDTTQEMQKLVSGVEEFDNFTVYSFNRPDAITIKFSTSDNDVKSLSPPQSMSPSREATREDLASIANNGSAYANSQAGSRRGSISSLITRMLPFASPKKQEPSPRGRSKSVVPGSKAATAVVEVKVTPAADRGRRHSVQLGEPSTSATQVKVQVPEEYDLATPRASVKKEDLPKRPLLTIKKETAAPSMDMINEEADITSGTSMPIPSKTVPVDIKVSQVKPKHLAVSTTAHDRERKFSVSNNDTAYGNEIRSIRFGLNMVTVNNIKEAAELLLRMERILTKTKATYDKRGRFTFVVRHESYNGEVVYEVEVCKVWMLNIFGVRIKRLAGDALAYKDQYDKMSLAVKSDQLK